MLDLAIMAQITKDMEHYPKVKHVKGHSGVPGNEQADALAEDGHKQPFIKKC